MKILEVEQICLDFPFKIQVHILLDPFHGPNIWNMNGMKLKKQAQS